MSDTSSYSSTQQHNKEDNEETKRQQQEAIEEQRRVFLKQILTPEASERLANIKLVKPEKARVLEDSLIRSAQLGRIPGKVDEEQLKQFLSQFNEVTDKKTKVTISRRKAFDDDDDF
eukprot:jgi/Galph1/5501/GphlegSOOS_G4110.1